jgi:flagellar hook-length control protein FliK
MLQVFQRLSTRRTQQSAGVSAQTAIPDELLTARRERRRRLLDAANAQQSLALQTSAPQSAQDTSKLDAKARQMDKRAERQAPHDPRQDGREAAARRRSGEFDQTRPRAESASRPTQPALNARAAISSTAIEQSSNTAIRPTSATPVSVSSSGTPAATSPDHSKPVRNTSIAHLNAVMTTAGAAVRPNAPSTGAARGHRSSDTVPAASSLKAAAAPQPPGQASHSTSSPEAQSVASGQTDSRRETAAAAQKASAAASTVEATDSASEANVERLLRLMRGRLDQGGGPLVMRLDPEHLGHVRVEMELRGDALTVTMAPETAVARDLLRDHQSQLANGLEQAGIRLERMEVLAPESAADSASSESGSREGAFGREGGAHASDGDDRASGERSSSSRDRSTMEREVAGVEVAMDERPAHVFSAAEPRVNLVA